MNDKRLIEVALPLLNSKLRRSRTWLKLLAIS